MSNGRVKNSIRNIIYRLISQAATILLRFISRSIFIYILGVEYLGINGLFSEILQMLSLADLGFGTAMVFSMYKPLAEHNETKLAQLVQLYKKIYMIIAVVITGIGLVLVPFLQYIVNLDDNIPYLRVYYILYLANTVASYLVVYKTCILNADQKNYLVSKYNTIFNIISVIMCSAFLFITHNFMVYLIVQVAITYINNFYQSHIAEKLYPFILKKVPPLPIDERKNIFDNVKSVFIYKLANTMVSSTDNTLISILIGTVIVGYYSNYNMIISNVTLVLNIIFSSITASLGNLVVENNTEKNYSVYKTMQFISFMLSTIAIVGTYLLINDFVSVWLGEEFVLDDLVRVAIVINMYFSIVLMPIWSYREATGIYRQTKYVMVATALVNLILSIALGKTIGLAGILFATSLARLSTYFWYEPKLLFAQFFNKKVSNYYKGIFYNMGVSVFLTILFDLLFKKVVVVNWIGFFIKFLLVAGSTTITTLVFYIKSPELKKVYAMIKAMIPHKSM